MNLYSNEVFNTVIFYGSEDFFDKTKGMYLILGISNPRSDYGTVKKMVIPFDEIDSIDLEWGDENCSEVQTTYSSHYVLLKTLKKLKIPYKLYVQALKMDNACHAHAICVALYTLDDVDLLSNELGHMEMELHGFTINDDTKIFMTDDRLLRKALVVGVDIKPSNDSQTVIHAGRKESATIDSIRSTHETISSILSDEFSLKLAVKSSFSFRSLEFNSLDEFESSDLVQGQSLIYETYFSIHITSDMDIKDINKLIATLRLIELFDCVQVYGTVVPPYVLDLEL